MFTSIKIALHERYRQINEEGWTPEHDFEHDRGILAEAAVSYLESAFGNDSFFPFTSDFDKRDEHSQFKKLVIGVALALAEIDRYLMEVDIDPNGFDDEVIEEIKTFIDKGDSAWDTEIINGVRKYLKNQAGASRSMGMQAAQDVQEREEMINKIEATYPPDGHRKGPDILIKALARSWRELPMPFLRSLQQVCLSEDYKNARGRS